VAKISPCQNTTQLLSGIRPETGAVRAASLWVLSNASEYGCVAGGFKAIDLELLHVMQAASDAPHGVVTTLADGRSRDSVHTVGVCSVGCLPLSMEALSQWSVPHGPRHLESNHTIQCRAEDLCQIGLREQRGAGEPAIVPSQHIQRSCLLQHHEYPRRSGCYSRQDDDGSYAWSASNAASTIS